MSHDQPQHTRMSDAERETRIALAACYRLAAYYRLTDLIYTHITARVPGEEGYFLINPYGWRWEEITASSLVKIDVDGHKVDNSPEQVNPAGFTIHSAIHGASHAAAWVMHTHTRAGVAVSSLEAGLETRLNQIALQFHERVSYHDYEGIALNLAERERIVASLGNNPALVLRNHGLLTTGASAAEMFNNMFYLERACELQVAAYSTGQPLRLVPEDVARHVARQYDQTIHEDGDLQLEWAAHLRTLEAQDPSYKD
ncbi:class II aldolase/adducin family protein [Halomonas sp. ISL-60]|uniref:class II aldolase/adducin family protein n=1 Tax=Halomonas sp. ISL-56 TaxID=2819149 RepID=UPI001BEC8C4B|nr:class II aldolase/adducin family protein [Halomonas sp. ISL-56]MBT2771076.1 class II aldolase/adducin family protein [Halomonas sp. ISL-60]MBT2799848.1 class II aldolase/adducin family protein [Halomonas sp. ISL-56]